jgi:hypothetical protein
MHKVLDGIPRTMKKKKVLKDVIKTGKNSGDPLRNLFEHCLRY